MDLGMIGLGRMGGNMSERLLRSGHRVVGFDRGAESVASAKRRGVETVDSLAALVRALPPPRALWMMVPAGAAVDETIDALLPMLASDDVLIDGGNSNYKDSQRRAQQVASQRIHYVDAGTSGGVWGLKEGYSLMVGGDATAIERLRPILSALAPSPDRGWGRVGGPGAGHFAKMIHNGIEYGMMQAFAEGFAIMDKKRELGLDLAQVAEVWRFGSVVRSWLLDLTAAALANDATLGDVAAYVADSGEGRWTVQEAIDLGVSAPVITESLLRRLRSRESAPYADRLLAVMRQAFGGHAVHTREA
ncbi:MAG: decarboxylating 6-phosphogluconate dehydrogenase [Planctomycetota bacterium]